MAHLALELALTSAVDGVRVAALRLGIILWVCSSSAGVRHHRARVDAAVEDALATSNSAMPRSDREASRTGLDLAKDVNQKSLGVNE
jgi:hypothetical protein